MPERASWEARLNDIWYSADRGRWLQPLATLFAGISGLRRMAYSAGIAQSERVAAPVIVIGNITVGGTGKTPLTIFLAQRLRQLGLRPGIATRGYGRSGKGVSLVDADSSAEVVGDEALLLFRRSGVPVCVGARRVAAAARLVEAGCNIVLCDDGLQHMALQRDLEIAVVDGARGLGNGRLLPAGPLREAPGRLDSVDLTVINLPPGPGAGWSRNGALGMRLVGTQAVSMLDAARVRDIADFAGETVHAVAAIGHPARFFASLRAAGLTLVEHPFPDHHHFAAADLQFGDTRPVLMTEKDAVKCSRQGDERLWYVPVEANFEPADERRLLARVTALLETGEVS
ncbi:MAG: tetraacyldisaccharide 4'-kinase [Pseudomonadota bacterium]